MIVSLEPMVGDVVEPLAVRVTAWARLHVVVKWGDLQRLLPDMVDLRENGLVAALVRTMHTKTSGTGKRRQTLPVFVPLDAFASRPTWLEEELDLWKELGDLDWDFFLPRSLPDLSGFSTTAASASGAAWLSAHVLTRFRVPSRPAARRRLGAPPPASLAARDGHGVDEPQ